MPSLLLAKDVSRAESPVSEMSDDDQHAATRYNALIAIPRQTQTLIGNEILAEVLVHAMREAALALAAYRAVEFGTYPQHQIDELEAGPGRHV